VRGRPRQACAAPAATFFCSFRRLCRGSSSSCAAGRRGTLRLARSGSRPARLSRGPCGTWSAWSAPALGQIVGQHLHHGGRLGRHPAPHAAVGRPRLSPRGASMRTLLHAVSRARSRRSPGRRAPAGTRAGRNTIPTTAETPRRRARADSRHASCGVITERPRFGKPAAALVSAPENIRRGPAGPAPPLAGTRQGAHVHHQYASALALQPASKRPVHSPAAPPLFFGFAKH